MPICDVNGFKMNYRISGRSDAPFLLLSNSLGTSLEMWGPQTQSFEEHFQVVRYDMRGHGSSTTPPGPYTIEILGRDLLALLHELRIATVDFCGLSIGGVIGQWLGIHEPSVVRRLVLCNTAAKIGNADSWNQRIASVERDGMKAIASGVLRRWFSDAFLASDSVEFTMMAKMLEEADPAGYIATCEALRDMDLRDRVQEIKLPVCIIAGSLDTVTTLEDAEWLAREIAGASLESIPAAHISSTESPDLFNKAVLSFLLEGTSGSSTSQDIGANNEQ